VTYEQARAAFETGGRLYEEGIVLMVTRVLWPNEDADVLWMTDAKGLGDAGVLLVPDDRVEKRTPQVADPGVLP